MARCAIELGSSYTGTLVLNSANANSYSGGTILNGGTLLLGTTGDDLLGSSADQGDPVVSPVTFGGGTLELSTTWTSSRSLTINPGLSTISEQTPAQGVNLTPASIHWNGGTLTLTNTGASHLTSGGTVSVTALRHWRWQPDRLWQLLEPPIPSRIPATRTNTLRFSTMASSASLRPMLQSPASPGRER